MKRVFFLAAGMFALGSEDYLFPGLLPGISTSLRASVVSVAQGCTVFGVAYLLSVPLCAYLLSKRPAQSVLIMALVLFLTGNGLSVSSTNLAIYLTSRFIAGLGAGLYLPVAVAFASRVVESNFRARALSAVWSFNCAGAVIGVPLGLGLAARMGWRVSISAILILGVFALIGLSLQSPQLNVETPPSLSDQLRVLTDARVMGVIGVTFLTATGALGLYTYITPLLAETGNSADIAFSLWSVGGLLGSLGIGYVVDRVGKPQVVMGIILAVFVLVLTSLPLLRTVPTLGLLPFLLWGGLGWATVTPQQYRLINIKADHEAILIALNSSAVSLGSVVGCALGGLALAGGLNPKYLPYLFSACLLSALLCQIALIYFESHDLSRGEQSMLGFLFQLQSPKEKRHKAEISGRPSL
jgi:predicted MFS family arabinose efflux permease